MTLANVSPVRHTDDVARTSAPSNRRRIISEVLERYHELTDPMQSRDGTGDGEHVPLMPGTYTATVRELERLLCVMRQDRHRALITLTSGERVSVRSLWWHCSERYLRCTVATKDVPVIKRAKKGKTFVDVERRAVVTYSPLVKLDRVDRAIGWLAENWSLASEPMLPRELLAA